MNTVSQALSRLPLTKNVTFFIRWATLDGGLLLVGALGFVCQLRHRCESTFFLLKLRVRFQKKNMWVENPLFGSVEGECLLDENGKRHYALICPRLQCHAFFKCIFLMIFWNLVSKMVVKCMQVARRSATQLVFSNAIGWIVCFHVFLFFSEMKETSDWDTSDPTERPTNTPTEPFAAPLRDLPQLRNLETLNLDF